MLSQGRSVGRASKFDCLVYVSESTEVKQSNKYAMHACKSFAFACQRETGLSEFVEREIFSFMLMAD